MSEPKWMSKINKRQSPVEAIDIPTMMEMDDAEYRAYARDGLVFTDHHWILRSAPAGYPLAGTNRQLDILIEELEAHRGTLND